jgi:hypothetical protein
MMNWSDRYPSEEYERYRVKRAPELLPENKCTHMELRPGWMITGRLRCLYCGVSMGRLTLIERWRIARIALKYGRWVR